MQWRLVRSELGKVRQPVRLFRSATGHTVEPVNSRIVLEGVGSADVTEIVLPDSSHPDRVHPGRWDTRRSDTGRSNTATRDHDAPTSFTGSVAYIHRIHQERVEELA